MIDDVKIIKTQPYASNILNKHNNVPSAYFGGTSYRIMPLNKSLPQVFLWGLH